MAVDERLLNGVKPVFREALDRDQFLAVEGGQELDAGVDRADPDILTAAIQFRHHHRAGAAVTLGTTFLGSGATQILTQKLHYGARRVDILDFDDRAVEHERDRAAGCVHTDRARHVPQLPR